MISIEDAPFTYEFNDHFRILPSIMNDSDYYKINKKKTNFSLTHKLFADLQISKSPMGPTKNLERLYNQVVVRCLFVCNAGYNRLIPF